MNHIFRSDGVKDHFNGQIENREMPGWVSVEEQVRYGEEYAGKPLETAMVEQGIHRRSMA
jgi:hypothetical protein